MTLHRTALIIALAVFTSACGIKGDLFIPERPAVSAADGSKASDQGTAAR